MNYKIYIHIIVKYVPATNMAFKCHKYGKCPKYLTLHLSGKYANLYATYEVAPINDVTRIAVHKG